MIPPIVAKEIRQSLLDYLNTTFSLRDNDVASALLDFVTHTDRGLFKGPYLQLRLPFRRVDAEVQIPLEIAPSFRPYLHQQLAFQRLSSLGGHEPIPTLVTTGTGSGKTECFSYPLLDHVYRHAGQPGIKAIILYPMNALAGDQAGRLGKTIWEDSRLRGRVSAGMYIGDNGPHGTMGPDHIIDDKDVIRRYPPDFLLTNYKMLDFLLLRPEDRALWARNAPDTLRYLVLDELHTYDGAQGADVACLIRRLKARLNAAPGSVCPVGTSATIGGESEMAAEALRDFAAKLFGEHFSEDSVITENRLKVESYLGTDQIELPVPASRTDLGPLGLEPVEEYVGRQAEAWLGEPTSDPIEIAERLRKHPFLRLLLQILGKRPRPTDEILSELERLAPDFAEAERGEDVVAGFLSLVAWARVPDGERVVPFLTCQIHFWTRELTRLLRELGEEPRFLWWEPRISNRNQAALPAIFCDDCGTSGWVTTESSPGSPLSKDPRAIYVDFIERHRRLRPLLPGRHAGGTVARINPRTMRLLPLALSDDATELVNDEGHLLVTVADHLSQRTPPRNLRRCPACETNDSLRIIGSGAATLGSVAVSHLFQSPYNTDKKLISFTDSVQDASHRAGFFTARTYRFNLRTGIQALVESRPGITLADAGEALVDHWQETLPTPSLVATFVPRDLSEQVSIRAYLDNPTHGNPKPALDVLRSRLSWEVAVEYGLASRVGRTLDLTATSTAALDPRRLEAAVEKLVLRVSEELPGFVLPDPSRLRHLLEGLLHRLRIRGGIEHPMLARFIAERGNWYFLTKTRNPLISTFTSQSVLPRFITTETDPRVFDRFVATSKRGNWFHEWAQRAVDAPADPGQLNDFFRLVFQVLTAEDVLVEHSAGPSHHVYGLNRAALSLTPEANRLRCDQCGARITIPSVDAERWSGKRCISYRCTGEYAPESDQRSGFYQSIYRSGRVQRIFADEHTGLLSRAERESVEHAFKNRPNADSPNLLCCTPTLELGIDIGDLSATMAASVPPTPANYLQRIGRAGRSTGNAVLLTLASSQSHDLYFFEDPLRMVAGEVLPPGCFLDAAEVLKRQFVAFAMDTFNSTEGPERLPHDLRMLLAAYQKKEFPRPFLDWLAANAGDLLQRFEEMFGAFLSDRTRERLSQFLHDGEIEARLVQGLERAKTEREEAQRRIRRLRDRRKDLEEHPEQMLAEERERALKEIDVERRALVELVKELEQKYVLNFFTDEGLLPNYAFPEDGVALKSTIIRRKDSGEPAEIVVAEYRRAASTAIRELAPYNTFYAGHRHVQIDQVETGGHGQPHFESWHFCPACSYVERVVAETVAKTCPRCGTPNWGDLGQRRAMLRLRRVSARADAASSLNLDQSDERDRGRYHTRYFLEVEPENLRGGFADPSIPFGFEHLERIGLREVNFGPHDSGAQTATFQAAGDEFPEGGFEICRDCGVAIRRDKDEIIHRAACLYRSGGQKEKRERVFLYRHVESEAIRLLLPVSTFEQEERRTSFKAGLEYGLRLRFGGRPIHLAVLNYEEPVVDGAEGIRQFLVLYDLVPGGTGYLAELVKTGGLVNVMEMALEGMLACRCAEEDDGRDGCHNCVLAYQTRFEQELVSRRLAVEMFSEITSRKEHLKPVDTIGTLPVDVLQESELERRFLAALQEYVERTEDAKWTPAAVGARRVYELRLGQRRYLVDSQVDLGPSSGVEVPSRPDFVIRPLRRAPGDLPVAVFTDGLAYHVKPGDEHGEIREDVRKRVSIIASEKFRVWSITWWDIEEFLSERLMPTGWLPKLAARSGEILRTLDSSLPRDVIAMNPMAQLIEYLREPRMEQWRQAASSAVLAGIVANGGANVTDDSATAAASLLLERREPLDPGVPELTSGFGDLRAAVEHESQAVAYLCGGTLDGCKSLLSDRLGAIVRLDDSSELRADAQVFRAPWRAFLAALNLFQHLPNASFASSELIDAYGPVELKRPFTHLGKSEQPQVADVADEGARLTDEASALLELLVDSNLRAALRGILLGGAPLPEAGFELTDSRGRVVGEAEVAWPNARVAVLLPGQAGERNEFERADWHVFESESFVENVDPVLSLLGHEEEGAGADRRHIG